MSHCPHLTDTVARFWPCAPASVYKILGRCGVDRVGLDNDTGQALYRAPEVAYARGSRPGPGARTDIRDHSLATGDRIGYLAGRWIAALDGVLEHDPDLGHRPAATGKIHATNGQFSRYLIQAIEDQYRRLCQRVERTGGPDDLPTRVTITRPIVDELAPVVRNRSGHPSMREKSDFVLGYHHQCRAIDDAVRAAKRLRQ